MIQLLIDNPLLLLFVVAAIGYPLGRIKIRGSSLGVAAVLFVGLAIGALHPDLKLPEIIYLLGLALFVYTIGLSSGPGFFASFRSKGFRDNGLVAVILVAAAALAAVAHTLLGLRPTLTAGMFAGAMTNTPALAGVVEYVKSISPNDVQAISEPVIGYSLTYPMGVVGMILAITLMQRLWKTDYTREADSMPEFYTIAKQIESRTIAITRHEATLYNIAELTDKHKWDVVFGRMKRGDQMLLINGNTCLQRGDQITVVGTREELDCVLADVGEPGDDKFPLDRSEIDFRRIFVSNPEIAGRRLRDLGLQKRFGAVITRVRRGDHDLLPHGETVLELGDRVRVLTQRQRMEEVSAFFGDSYRALSEIDIMTFSLGLALGLLLGILPIPLPGGVTLKLGFAGGPLIMALILGTISRTGPMVWSLPYSANLTLRQFGLIMFLAGVGTRSGYSFATTLAQGSGLPIFAAGAAITFIIGVCALWIGHKLLGIPLSVMIGILAGLETQPAVLGYALEQTGNDTPNVGYATVYPMATIVKIILAQILVTSLH